MNNLVVGKVELQDKTNGIALRIQKYELIDNLNQCTNIIIAGIPPSIERDELLDQIKRVKELANNL